MNPARSIGNRTIETRNASNLSYVYSPPGSNWLYQRGSDTRIKSPNGNTLSSAAGSFAYNASGVRIRGHASGVRSFIITSLMRYSGHGTPFKT